MKRYAAPLGRIADLVHEAPERTATRSGPGVFADVQFQVWHSRGAMLKTVQMQGRSPHHWTHWRPLVP